MNEPTPRAFDAIREFCDGISVLARENGGAFIALPIMGPADRQVAYVIDAVGNVEQRVEQVGDDPAIGPDDNTPPVTWGTYTGSVHDMRRFDDGERDL